MSVPVEFIKAGRAIGSSTLQRRREQATYVARAARERRKREADPTRRLTPLEERVLRRFGYDPYADHEISDGGES